MKDELFERFVKGKISESAYVEYVKHQHLVGKRVKATIGVGNNDMTNQQGAIIFARQDEILVQYDNDINGHDGASSHVEPGKDGHCWWMQDEEWEYIE